MAGRLDELIERARHVRMSPQQQEMQRRSFAYGTAVIENEKVTRDTISAAAEAIASRNVRVITVDESANISKK